jgi:indolepyruvate ferredoxin oxidoreductase alpha subunit
MRYAQLSPFNRLQIHDGSRRGIIATGVAINYFLEAAGDDHGFNLLTIGAYPWPQSLVREMLAACDEILLLEDGSPFVERELLGLTGVPGKTIRGRLNGDVPMQGELTTDIVRAALAGKPQEVRRAPAVELTKPSKRLSCRTTLKRKSGSKPSCWAAGTIRSL